MSNQSEASHHPSSMQTRPLHGEKVRSRPAPSKVKAVLLQAVVASLVLVAVFVMLQIAPTTSAAGAPPGGSAELPGPGVPADPGSAAGPNEQSQPDSAPLVVLYGDSLAWESRGFFEWFAADRGWRPISRVFGGTAPCDWVETFEADLELRPAVVVFAFSGNSMTPCMTDPNTGAAFAGPAVDEKYRVDLTHLAETAGAHGISSTIIGPPVAASGGGASLHEVYREVADSTTNSTYIDGGSAIAPDGAHQPTMPCLPDEEEMPDCVDGNIRVRSDDGLHLCPAQPVNVDGMPECPIYSSGARRYAEALAPSPG